MAEPMLHSRPSGVERLADSLDKPLLDDRTYRVIKLPNQLEVLLIHDAKTDKASAAMDVNVGSFSDEPDMPGMAHAVEHLLFMGTEKYPGENDYSAYLTKYGGYANAFTAHVSTNYYFELSASATSNSRGSSANSSRSSLRASKNQAPLYGALDRFSQFFVKPLFSEDTLDRELRAVDSENKKNLQSDTWRLFQLNRGLANKEHPYNTFATGNYEVLHDEPIARGVNIRDEFIAFYKKHYSANRMKLVVLGKEELDELQSWVEELFKDVPDQNLPQLRWDGIPVYSKDEMCTEVFVKPVMEQRKLDMVFEYFDDEDLWESKPGRYLSHLIGHEGPGSLLSYLKGKGWANELSAGASPMCPGSGLFQTGITLTESGLEHYRDVIKAFFQYVAMLKEKPPQEWIQIEMAKLADVDFKFRQKVPASRTTSGLSGVMQNKALPRDQLLAGQYTCHKFDPVAINRAMDTLRPDNFRLNLVSKEASSEFPAKEKWYGTEYKLEKMPEDFLKELEATVSAPASTRPSELHYPGKNEFVPERFDVEKKEVPEPATSPKLIRNDENVRLWYKKDDQFWVPKANVYVCLRSPLTQVSPLTSMITHMYKELVQDSLDEYSYDADLAGLRYSISGHNLGLDVQVSGYNDKMPVLLEKVLLSMRDLEVKEDRFEILKERTARGIRNFDYMEPYRQINMYTRWLSTERSWLQAELLEELPSITPADVRAFIPQVLKQLHIEILATGNLYKEDALRVGELVERTLSPRRLPPSQWPTKRAMILPPGSNFRYPRTLKNPDNINHCIEYVLHVGTSNERPMRAKLLLMAQMLDEPCFNTLRTQEQLGYIVGSGALLLNTVQGFRIIIQSEKDCEFLEKRIDNFLTNFETELRQISHDDFDKHRIGLINKRMEKLKNLSEEAGRLWHHVTSEAFDFELVYRDVEQIEQITKADMVDFYNAYFHPASSTRAKAAVHMIAQSSASDLAAKTSPAEQVKNLTSTLSQILTQLNITVDDAALSARMQKLDLKTGGVDGVVDAVSVYLKESAGMAEEQVSQVIAQGKVVLPQVLPALGIAGQPGANGEVVSGGNNENPALNGNGTAEKKAVVIEDVRAWKASLPVSRGPKAVRPLSDFEELGSKL